MIKKVTVLSAAVFLCATTLALAQEWPHGPSSLSINAIAKKGARINSVHPEVTCATTRNVTGAFNLYLQGFDPQDAQWGAKFNTWHGYTAGGDGIIFDKLHPTIALGDDVGPKYFSVYINSDGAMPGHDKCVLIADVFNPPFPVPNPPFPKDEKGLPLTNVTSMGVCYSNTTKVAPPMAGALVLDNCHVVFWPSDPNDCPAKFANGALIAGFGMRCRPQPNGTCLSDSGTDAPPMNWQSPLTKQYPNVHGWFVR